MKYRRLSPSGDFTFGQSSQNYLSNTPSTVAQAVQTALTLWLGEWFLDLNAGTPYPEGVLGKHGQQTADNTIVARISQVQGMVNIQGYKSQIDPGTRKYSVVGGTLNTIYGQTELQMQNQTNF